MATWGPITVMVHDLLFLLLRVSKKYRLVNSLYLWVLHIRIENILGKKIPESSKTQSLNLQPTTIYIVFILY